MHLTPYDLPCISQVLACLVKDSFTLDEVTNVKTAVDKISLRPQTRAMQRRMSRHWSEVLPSRDSPSPSPISPSPSPEL